ncbi:hypothetical protein EP073_09485 [Geovibrio thiophilus]|uniref:Nucleoside phosphorylase domain-containing protein n=1 Tax=Geovibrio thiophilus TaxID=139438 RepID=A0A410JZN9_9BACT|nr:hypothetical protein [Geovibrio thiophilus]QAR33624.1 hypothetical protein EP073_09485 [Geovibrio thiophilus]
MILLFPTVNELYGSLGKITLNEWKYGILNGEWKGMRVFITGVTKTNAAFSSALIFSEIRPEQALLAGICGAYRQSGLKTGDIVSVVKDWFVDEALFFGSDIRLLGEEGFPVCENNFTIFEKIPSLNEAVSNTVSLLSSCDNLANLYYNKTGASVENMEGASVGLSAARFNVRTMQVRSISNYCGERTKQEWDLKPALRSLGTLFQSIF